VSDGTVTEYGWDHRNRLTSVTFKTSGGTVTKAVQYEYDAYNRLVTKKLDADGNGTFTDNFWIYDGNQAVLQFDGNTAADLSHRYLWGPAVDQLLADETVDNGGAEDVLWPLGDWQGSVRHLAEYDESTSTTSIENEKFYDAYGNVTSESNSAVDTLFGYTGRMFDDDTGLQNNLNRWYDPKTGRWISEDPIGFSAGDPNLYRYVGNSPGDRVDPGGQQECFNLYCDLRPTDAKPEPLVAAPTTANVQKNLDEWYAVHATVVKTKYFQISGRDLRGTLNSVSRFYHRYGILIHWQILEDNRTKSELCDLDLRHNKPPMTQPDVKWYYEQFEDRLTVFLIDHVDVDNTASTNDPSGVTADFGANFIWVADQPFMKNYDKTIVHELGHAFDLRHAKDYEYSNIMHERPSSPLQAKEFEDWQVDDIKKHPHLKPIGNPKAHQE
jgi:RHS repeat-associated protein